MSQDGRRGDGIDGIAEWGVVEDDGVLDASDTLDDDRVADPLDTGVAAVDRWAAPGRGGGRRAGRGPSAGGRSRNRAGSG
jgi:hypothetical protein